MAIAIPQQCYPLRWPAGVPRAVSRRTSAFVKMTPGRATDEVYHELKLAKAKTIIVSSNMPLRSDGTPSADSSQRPGGDPGVVAYWTIPVWRKNQWSHIPHCMPCDRWDRIACNLHAIALSIGAMRGMERWGAVSVEQAFAGFAALPAGSDATPAKVPWRDVIGGSWPELDPAELLAIAKARHRRAITDAHPDRGGSHERAAELNAALAEAEQELGHG